MEQTMSHEKKCVKIIDESTMIKTRNLPNMPFNSCAF